MSIKQRKKAHIDLVLNQDVNAEQSTGLERYRLVHQALPEINLADISTQTAFFGKTLNAPLTISAMTGGEELGKKINKHLAQACQQTGIAMCLGSCRIALAHPETKPTFSVRKYAPDIFLMANLGAVQLNYGFGPEECLEIVELTQADALMLHLNPLQECIQPEGDTNWKHLVPKIADVCKALKRRKIPVFAKEVGTGISSQTAFKLKRAGIAAIETAGLGGTNFALVESYRAQNTIGKVFRNWGIPTADAILCARKTSLPVIASGGIRSGIDIATSLALGASIAGLAAPLLKPACQSAEAVVQRINELAHELRIAMFCSGAKTIKELQAKKLVRK